MTTKLKNDLINRLLSDTHSHISGEENGVAVFTSEKQDLRKSLEGCGFTRRVDSSRCESWGFDQYWNSTETLFAFVGSNEKSFSLCHGDIQNFSSVLSADFAQS